MMDRGNQSDAEDASPTPPLPSLMPAQAVEAAMKGMDSESAAQEAAKRGADLAAKEEKSFQELKRKIDALVKEAGLSTKVSTTITRRGLKVRLLTDRLLFDSGSAVIKPGAFPTLDAIGRIIAEEGKHPVEIEGHTDNRPIHTSQYPSNWQLSGGRAAAVVQRLIGAGVLPRRTSLAGYAAQQPVARNATSAGRARNRRVEIILTRVHGANLPHGGG
jgi:chemotaxis protein MotB